MEHQDWSFRLYVDGFFTPLYLRCFAYNVFSLLGQRCHRWHELAPAQGAQLCAWPLGLPPLNLASRPLLLHQVVDKPAEQHKTLSHAISRAAATGAIDLQNSGSADKLSEVLQTFSVAQDRVGGFRLEQDKEIQKDFLAPWSALTNNQIPAAMKARSNVKSARLVEAGKTKFCRQAHLLFSTDWALIPPAPDKPHWATKQGPKPSRSALRLRPPRKDVSAAFLTLFSRPMLILCSQLSTLLKSRVLCSEVAAVCPS